LVAQVVVGRPDVVEEQVRALAAEFQGDRLQVTRRAAPLIDAVTGLTDTLSQACDHGVSVLSPN
ncbi:hypothetical protein, partial [Streptomyces sp. NPDC048551]|uniref:hypothetical protein n=1 Tax=Streptomyces sp. NPDC048551 TaxID=3155758 RepID=UPI00341F3790